MHVELVRVETIDGLRLDGALQRPVAPEAEGPVDAALLLHGVGGNFYSSTLLESLVQPLLSRGIAVLRVNTRGRDGLFTANTIRGVRRFGAAYEVVDECRFDLSAWRSFLLAEGYPRIALVGHSLGAIKAIYVSAKGEEGAYARVAALSPPRLAYSVFLQGAGSQTFQETIALAEACMADGRRDELLNVRFPFPLVITAASYLDKYGPQERYDILRHVSKMTCPALFLYGEKELATGGTPFAGLDRAVADAARPGQPLSVQVVPGADHFYSGVTAAAAAEVAKWLGA